MSSQNPREKSPSIRLPSPKPRDPEIEKAWKEEMINGLQRNDEMFKKILRGFTIPFWLSVGMNLTLFIIGACGFTVAMIYSLIAKKTLFSLIFGCLDIATIITFFFTNPIKRLERDMGFITWIGLVYNTYWAQLMYAQDIKTFQNDSQNITTNAINSIKELLDKHKNLE